MCKPSSPAKARSPYPRPCAQDTHRADLFAVAIEDLAHLLVTTLVLFEVHRVLSRSLTSDLVNRCLDVMRLGRVLDFTDAQAIASAHIAARH